MVEERIVGSVRATVRDDTCFIGRLIVHPEVQDQGIGTRLLAEIEACFPLRSAPGCYAGVRRYELFTGHRSQKNLHLYDKLGYRPLRTQRLNDRLTLVYLEKTNAVHGCGDRT
ncbi:MAG: GNAT family N-acetyltransferase [Chloroflexi bacterium]|nr:MAG: GNAT family N-acetyltransferase [Chloroflexota bacterium]